MSSAFGTEWVLQQRKSNIASSAMGWMNQKKPKLFGKNQ